MLTPISKATASAVSMLSKNYSGVSTAALRILRNMLTASKKSTKWTFSPKNDRNLFVLRKTQ